MAAAIRSSCFDKLRYLSLKDPFSCSSSSPKEVARRALGRAAPSSFCPQTPISNGVFHSAFSTAATAARATFRSLGLFSAFSHNVLNKGYVPISMAQKSVPYSTASVLKRIRRAEKMRIKNKSRRTKVKTRMKKVFLALDELKNKPEVQPEEFAHIDELIKKAHSTIRKAVSAGVLHRNTGERRKARLARRKTAVELHHGLITPAPEASAT
ncbi:hypothetical protein K2173_011910 [Erythroxylum novogranatense]|uniref:30S ribosomal protein S20, chloroplastic n=1 Tax=Erythroxylum novogranatense TaxID=1862640 RepID=A0AAV8TG40_9ROSI|nr:hypothetical protein K2173_011910 [Erythroxylum novogranatense]